MERIVGIVQTLVEMELEAQEKEHGVYCPGPAVLGLRTELPDTGLVATSDKAQYAS